MSISSTWCMSAAVAVLAAGSFTVAVAEPVAADASTTVFVNHAQMREWLADGERGLWIQAGNLKWFYARFNGVCHGLNSTNSVVFDTRASGNIDRATSVVVPGRGRCTVQTFTASGGPPKKRNADVAWQPQAQ
jgi:uncharacterized protein DUF6491